jgi:hypothetical protein
MNQLPCWDHRALTRAFDPEPRAKNVHFYIQAIDAWMRQLVLGVGYCQVLSHYPAGIELPEWLPRGAVARNVEEVRSGKR